MAINEDKKTKLPVRSNLKLIYVLSFIIAFLAAFVSTAGIVCQKAIYPSEDLIMSLLPTDVSLLIVGLPMLLGSMWLTRKGKLIGLLLWPGALFLMLYNYLVYIFAMPLNAAFLAYLTLVMLSVYTISILLTSIDSVVVHDLLSGNVPDRFAGGILVGFGLIFFLRVIGVLVIALINHEAVVDIDFALSISDYLIAPAWVIGGLSLWRRKAFGYVTGLGFLYQACMLFIQLIIAMLSQVFLTNTPLVLVDIFAVLAMGMICFIPFTLFVQGVVYGKKPNLS